MNNQSQELIELIFNLKHISGSPRFALIEDHGFLSIEDCISDVQNELGFETSLADAIYWIKFENEISIMFALIDNDDIIYDLEIWFDLQGNPITAQVSQVDWGDKTIDLRKL